MGIWWRGNGLQANLQPLGRQRHVRLHFLRHREDESQSRPIFGQYQPATGRRWLSLDRFWKPHRRGIAFLFPQTAAPMLRGGNRPSNSGTRVWRENGAQHHCVGLQKNALITVLSVLTRRL